MKWLCIGFRCGLSPPFQEGDVLGSGCSGNGERLMHLCLVVGWGNPHPEDAGWILT